MPLHWTFSHPSRLVLAHAKGAVLGEEVLAFLARIDQEGARPYAKIFDVTELVSIFTDEQVRQLGEIVRQRNTQTAIGPIAIVASSDHTHAQAELFVGLRVTDQPMKVFREHHEARAWLDSVAPAKTP